jgi:hypothetical protein
VVAVSTCTEWRGEVGHVYEDRYKSCTPIMSGFVSVLYLQCRLCRTSVCSAHQVCMQQQLGPRSIQVVLMD